MRSSIKDLPVVAEMPEGKVQQTNWGNMIIEVGQFNQDFDGESSFKGLPDDRCQCPHWGYVVKGQLRFRYADHEEVYRAGDLYYGPPGHIPYLEAGCEYIEFSPADEYNKTMEIVIRNMDAK
jgi:hypothetical protein